MVQASSETIKNEVRGEEQRCDFRNIHVTCLKRLQPQVAGWFCWREERHLTINNFSQQPIFIFLLNTSAGKKGEERQPTYLASALFFCSLWQDFREF